MSGSRRNVFEAAGANGDLVVGWRLAPLDRAVQELDTTQDAATLFMARLATGLKRDPYLEAVRNDPCSYCDGPGGTLDHIDPRGRDSRGAHNVTGACSTCNQAKGDKPLLRFLLSPRMVELAREGLGLRADGAGA